MFSRTGSNPSRRGAIRILFGYTTNLEITAPFHSPLHCDYLHETHQEYSALNITVICETINEWSIPHLGGIIARLAIDKTRISTDPKIEKKNHCAREKQTNKETRTNATCPSHTHDAAPAFVVQHLTVKPVFSRIRHFNDSSTATSSRCTTTRSLNSVNCLKVLANSSSIVLQKQPIHTGTD